MEKNSLQEMASRPVATRACAASRFARAAASQKPKPQPSGPGSSKRT